MTFRRSDVDWFPCIGSLSLMDMTQVEQRLRGALDL